MALQIQPVPLARWAVCEGDVVVSDVVEEVDFVLGQHQRCGDRVNRSVPPSLVKEAAFLVEKVEVVHVSRGT